MKAALPVLAAAVLLAACSRHAPAPAAASPAPPAIRARVVTVRSERVPITTEIAGTVRPRQRALIAAKLMGVIEELPVALGQHVARGEVLAKIGAGEIGARLVQAQSQLSSARRDLERERELLTKGASTADTVRGLEDRFAAAQALVREAEVMVGYATIRAPFAGVIARKLAEAGDLASPGQPLLELEGSNGFEVEAGVPDSLVANLAEGAALAVEIPAAGVALTGRLREVSSAADANARSVTVKVTLPPHEAVRSGQFARIQIPRATEAALLAPATAVSRSGQMERMFVAAADNRAVLRLVKTGARRGERVEILAGLDDGERIVAAPPASLREGQLLELTP